jgi:hypothetical protein
MSAQYYTDKTLDSQFADSLSFAAKWDFQTAPEHKPLDFLEDVSLPDAKKAGHLPVPGGYKDVNPIVPPKLGAERYLLIGAAAVVILMVVAMRT